MTDEISLKEAVKLVNTGEWMFEDDLCTHLEELIKTYIERFLADELVREKVLVPATKPPYWRLTGVVKILRAEVTRTVESKDITPSGNIKYDPTLASLRLGGGKILKIGPTLHKASWSGLALIGAILSIVAGDKTKLENLFGTALGVAPNIKDIIAALRSSWESLTNPKERLVFETIFLLQGKSAVVNYDALAAKDYDNAYDRLVPTLKDIEEAIFFYPQRDEIPEQWLDSPPEQWRGDLQQVLSKLKSRSILKEYKGRWSIVF